MSTGDFAGRLLVLGLGASGTAAAEWGLKRAAAGHDVRVTVVDSRCDRLLETRAARLREQGAEVRLGTDEVPSADLVVASPGIRPDSCQFLQITDTAATNGIG